MREKIGQAAERAATSVSRRELLGRLGRGAMLMAAGLSTVALGGAKPPHNEPRPCNADSTHECYDKKEGDLCAAGFYYGTCKGPKRRGPHGGDTVACYCDIEGDPR